MRPGWWGGLIHRRAHERFVDPDGRPHFRLERAEFSEGSQAKTRGSKSSALTIEALSPVALMTKNPCRSAWRATPSAA